VNVDDLVRGAQKALSVRRVYGEPVERVGTTVLPVAAVRGGGGGGGDNQENGGGGFGLLARPVGVYVIRDGEVEWRPAIDVTRIVLAALATLAFLGFVRRR
jgi:uncharacterized spore protein YtfJ